MLRDLARHVSALRLEQVPESTLSGARRFVLDSIGCIIAARALESAEPPQRLGRLIGGVLGRTYVGTRLGDFMDFNEGYRGAHFGCGAVGAALAMAAERPVSGNEFLLAVLAGYEVAGRVSDAIGPYLVGEAFDLNYTPTWSICTPVTFAAAATASRLLALDERQTCHAYLLAAANAPVPTGGVWAREALSPETKYGDAGWAAVAGVTAALSAQLGYEGLPALDGIDELAAIVSAPCPDHGALTAGIGESWRIDAALYKHWPCCGVNFGVAHNLAEILRREAIDHSEIEGIVLEVGAVAIQPNTVIPQPRTAAGLQFSLPHAMAMIAMAIPPGPLWQCKEAMLDRAASALRDRVEVRLHPEPWPKAGQGNPRLKPSKVSVRARGREFHEETTVRSELPHFALPWTEERVVAKFRSLVEPSYADAIQSPTLTLGPATDVGALLTAVHAARPIFPEWPSSNLARRPAIGSFSS